MSEKLPEGLQHFQKDFEKAEKKVAGEIDPGVRSVGIAVAILLLLGSFLLPHTGSVNGWDVLASDTAAHEQAVSILAKIFVWFALVFGALTGIATLLTRRWVLAWISAAGCAVGVFLGVIAIWTRETPSGVPGAQDQADLAGPGVGIYVGILLLIVLTYLWVGVAWSKTSLQLAAEQERRENAAADEDAWMNQAKLGRPERPGTGEPDGGDARGERA